MAAAIITGTMASPSSPSVRFTALPAPTTTKAADQREQQPERYQQSLRRGWRCRTKLRPAR